MNITGSILYVDITQVDSGEGEITIKSKNPTPNQIRWEKYLQSYLKITKTKILHKITTFIPSLDEYTAYEVVSKSSPLECINNVTTHDDKPIEIGAFRRAASRYYQQMDDQPIIPN